MIVIICACAAPPLAWLGWDCAKTWGRLYRWPTDGDDRQ